MGELVLLKEGSVELWILKDSVGELLRAPGAELRRELEVDTRRKDPS
jgi:hypothetical protein